MKTKILFLSTIILSTIVFSGCSNESDGPGPEPRGKEKEVTLSIKTHDNNTKATRAGKDATSDEKTITGLAKVYVYDGDGKLEYRDEQVTLTPAKMDYTMKITSGTKYFYVFANTGANISVKNTRVEFEKQIIETGFGLEDLPDLCKNANFFMGTLWGVPVEIKDDDGDGKEAIELEIGRITAKIKLISVEKDKENNGFSIRPGTFTKSAYSIGGAANKAYAVGQYTGSLPPKNHSTYTSAVHSKLPGTKDVPNIEDFIYYSTWKEITAVPPTGPIDQYFYAMENTTAKDLQNKQYYGNTTHIQLETIYTPTKEEIWNSDLTEKGKDLITGTTFWTIIKDGVHYITNAEPTVLPDKDTKIKMYTDGKNYHVLAIADNDFKNDPVLRYAVLRNNYYEISVTGIKDLGDNEPITDPTIPIPDEVDVTATIKILDWSQVTQSGTV